MLPLMLKSISPLAATFLLLSGLIGCATAPDTAAGRADLENRAATALNTAKSADPTFNEFLNKGSGVAVFPSVGKGAIGIGGAYGKGVLFEDDLLAGYCDLSQASIGFQLGGQAYTELLVFADKDAIQRFKEGHFTFAAQATAVALKSGAATNAKFTDGVAAFTTAQTGLMYEASIGGQKFSYVSKEAAIQAETTTQPKTMPMAPVTMPTTMPMSPPPASTQPMTAPDNKR
jgi:lipid-binding SYLF domain-containing protein